ncbi:hypothetical protein ACFL2A_05455 [Thermodesulfobacteriota bacterium]
MYKLELKYPRVDISKNGLSRGFSVEKKIINTNIGKPVRVGDIVKVELFIDVNNRSNRYIVIDDPLPAGLVAINSALKSEEPVPNENPDEEYYWYRYWSSDGYYNFRPNFFEMRDDRVLAFRDYSWRGRFKYTYYARAIVEGDYIIPSTKVQLMYDHSVRGYSPQSSLRIEAMPDGGK